MEGFASEAVAPGRETLVQYNEAALARVRSFGESSLVSVPNSAGNTSSNSSAGHTAVAVSELEEMRKKLGQFMLGGDMSGGQAGTHAALTLSNAITNLSVGCWSQVAELAPLPPANLVKWRQQAKWYIAPLEQIIVKEEGLKTLADGTQVEVMKDVLREDVRQQLPQLRACDDAQQALYARFIDVEWEYAKPKPPAGGAGESATAKWWKKVAVMKGGDRTTLSEHWEKELSFVVAWAASQLAMCRQVNDACLERMETPEAFIEALPKHAKALPLGDALRRALEKAKKDASELGHAESVFGILAKDGIDADDKLCAQSAARVESICCVEGGELTAPGSIRSACAGA